MVGNTRRPRPALTSRASGSHRNSSNDWPDLARLIAREPLRAVPASPKTGADAILKGPRGGTACRGMPRAACDAMTTRPSATQKGGPKSVGHRPQYFNTLGVMFGTFGATGAARGRCLEANARRRAQQNEWRRPRREQFASERKGSSQSFVAPSVCQASARAATVGFRFKGARRYTIGPYMRRGARHEARRANTSQPRARKSVRAAARIRTKNADNDRLVLSQAFGTRATAAFCAVRGRLIATTGLHIACANNVVRASCLNSGSQSRRI